jgi:hypothetical protein
MIDFELDGGGKATALGIVQRGERHRATRTP